MGVVRVGGDVGGVGPGPIDALATEVHFLDHLRDLWHALDPAERGTFTVHPSLVPRARAYGIEPSRRPGRGAVCVVASYGDERRVKDRPVVYLEHGAGQTYSTAPGHHSYSGGKDHESVALFLAPSEAVAARWRARYPDARVEVIGAPPKLDRWFRDTLAHEGAPPGAPASRRGMGMAALPPDGVGTPHPVVAFAFHWAADRVAPEASTAWPTFGPFLDRLTEQFTVYGHGHPRCIRTLGPHYEHMGIEVVEDFESILGLADVLVVDNSSVAVEFASVGGPLVWLNSPNYRRDVHHGGRYWSWPQGQVQCDDPEDLADAVYRALDDPLSITKARERMVESVFPVRDGFAAVRAADAIRSLLESPDLPPRRLRMPRTNPYAPRTAGTARRAGGQESLKRGIAQAAAGEVQSLGSFAEYADDEPEAGPVQALTGVVQPVERCSPKCSEMHTFEPGCLLWSAREENDGTFDTTGGDGWTEGYSERTDQ